LNKIGRGINLPCLEAQLGAAGYKGRICSNGIFIYFATCRRRQSSTNRRCV